MVTLPKFTGSSVGPTVPVPIWLVIGAGALTIRFLRDITRPKPPNREKDVEKVSAYPAIYPCFHSVPSLRVRSPRLNM